MFTSTKKLREARNTTEAAASALKEALELAQKMFSENERLNAENIILRQQLLESLKRALELRQQLDAVDPGFLSAVGVKCA